MNLWDVEQYCALVKESALRFEDWDKLAGKKIVLSGGSGMILSYLIDVVMLHNRMTGDGISIVSTGRSTERFWKRFSCWAGEKLQVVQWDVSEPAPESPLFDCADYVIHGASTTHPRDYAAKPISTVMTNVMGASGMLEIAGRRQGSRFVLMSSVEIYGDNRTGHAAFAEADCGYINCNTLRAGYTEAKRVSEALCQAYRAERGQDAVILRIPRSYGPTLLETDSKALSQFMANALRGEDIVLKSEGMQLFSYAYVPDVVQGILYMLTRAQDGEAYNLADGGSDVRLRDLAGMIAACAGTKVVFDLPDAQERKGFSAAGVALMDSAKLRALGWQAQYDMERGVAQTMEILRRVR
ncbi:MAG: NAD-dependent epimerase/dehydratase family protein [Clostridia bacterium]|nr:NAD-dependent epimerase/dehydratase family protein [Clostridia bacterium]